MSSMSQINWSSATPTKITSQVETKSTPNETSHKHDNLPDPFIDQAEIKVSEFKPVVPNIYPRYPKSQISPTPLRRRKLASDSKRGHSERQTHRAKKAHLAGRQLESKNSTTIESAFQQSKALSKYSIVSVFAGSNIPYLDPLYKSKSAIDEDWVDLGKFENGEHGQEKKMRS